MTVCPPTKSYLDLNEIWYIGLNRLMHDVRQLLYHLIQDQGYRVPKPKVVKMAVFKSISSACMCVIDRLMVIYDTTTIYKF